VDRSPSAVGSRTEFAVACALSNAGRRVYLPLLNAHSRVDLIYESRTGGICRVQCKTGHIEDGTVAFWTCSNTGGVRKTYEGDVDEFGVFCPDNGCVYLVPFADVPSRAARLRLVPTKSGQRFGVRWANSYLLRSAT
jgi:hypothetical protein